VRQILGIQTVTSGKARFLRTVYVAILDLMRLKFLSVVPESRSRRALVSAFMPWVGMQAFAAAMTGAPALVDRSTKGNP